MRVCANVAWTIRICRVALYNAISVSKVMQSSIYQGIPIGSLKLNQQVILRLACIGKQPKWFIVSFHCVLTNLFPEWTWVKMFTLNSDFNFTIGKETKLLCCFPDILYNYSCYFHLHFCYFWSSADLDVRQLTPVFFSLFIHLSITHQFFVRVAISNRTFFFEKQMRGHSVLN